MLQVLESDSKTHRNNNDNNMLTNGSNQYIQPDYLATTLDSKRSPLALLAQTCSQIGADPTPSTTTSTTLSSSSSSSSSSSISVTKNVSDKPSKKPTAHSSDGANNNNNDKSSRKTPPQSKSQQQQYLDPYGRHESNAKESSSESSSSSSSKSGFKSPSSKSASATSPSNNNNNAQQQQSQQDSKFMAEQRMALDMAMQQQQQQQQQSQLSKDIQQSMLAAYHHRPSPVFPSPLSVGSLTGHHPLSPYHHPGLAGLDAATAAALGAFRHPAYSAVAHHLSGYPSHHVPVSLGLSLASYQQALSAVSYGQRLQQQQHQTSKAGGESAICRDPYCTGCPNSSPAAAPAVSSSTNSPNNNNNSSSSPATTTSTASMTSSSNSCPAGCTQCDHMTRTTTIAAAANNFTSTYSNGNGGLGLTSSTAALSSSLSMSTSTPSTIVTPASSDSLTLRPYVCNWIAADHYCGKRFPSSEELLQHLRTHTSLSVPPAVTSSAVGAEPSLSSPSSSSYSPVHHHQLLNPSLHPHSAHLLAASAAAALHRTYPTPPLSPLSMARYHPYSTAASSSKHLSSSGQPLQHSPLSTSAVPPTAAPPNTNPLLSLHHPYAAASLAGLPSYYPTHPYSLYSQRMLAGAGVLP